MVPQDSKFWETEEYRSRHATRPGHSLKVVRNGREGKTRNFHCVSRMGTPSDLGVYNNKIATVERALVERYFLCKVGGVYLPALKTEALSWRDELLCRFRALVVEPLRAAATVLTLREVVECYTGVKRRRYEAAYRSLQRKPLCPQDAELSSFAKFEKQNLEGAPRIINPRSERFNLRLGQYLKAMEKPFYSAINEVWGAHTDNTVIKGLNTFEAARVLKQKWDRFKDPVAVGADATKFDMHVTVQALKYEHSFYNELFKCPKLAKLLKMQLFNKGTAYCTDGKAQFTMPGTRSSGDLNTSLGNCILMCSLIWVLCHSIGIEAELANNGDDCQLICETTDLPRLLHAIPQFFEKYGFRMVVEEPVYEFEHIEFCQASPVLLTDGWCMVRNVRTCLKKDPMCLVAVQNDRVWRKWLGAVGDCGLASVPGCPVLQSFYNCFRRSGTKSRERFREVVFRNTGVMERSQGLTARIRPISPESRASFCKATGILPEYQIALEKYYDEMSIAGMAEKEFQFGKMELGSPPFIRHL